MKKNTTKFCRTSVNVSFYKNDTKLCRLFICIMKSACKDINRGFGFVNKSV